MITVVPAGPIIYELITETAGAFGEHYYGPRSYTTPTVIYFPEKRKVADGKSHEWHTESLLQVLIKE